MILIPLTTQAIIKYQLEEHYGESIAWDDSLEEAVTSEGLDISLTGELGESWRASEGETFRERVRDMIASPIEKLRDEDGLTLRFSEKHHVIRRIGRCKTAFDN